MNYKPVTRNIYNYYLIALMLILSYYTNAFVWNIYNICCITVYHISTVIAPLIDLLLDQSQV